MRECANDGQPKRWADHDPRPLSGPALAAVNVHLGCNRVTDAPEAKEWALQQSGNPRQSWPSVTWAPISNSKGAPPCNISAIKADIWRQMKPVHMAPGAAMIVLKAKIPPKPSTAVSVYRPTAMVQQANDAKIVHCGKHITGTSRHGMVHITSRHVTICGMVRGHQWGDV